MASSLILNPRTPSLRISCAQRNPLEKIGIVYHYVNGSFVTEEEARISIFDLSVMRGYGVFDYIQSYQGKPFHLMDHLIRLKWSADQVGLPLPTSLQEMRDLVIRLTNKNDPIDAGIRLIITGGTSSKDLLVPLDNHSNLVVFFHPFEPLLERYYTEGMRVVTTDLLRLFPAVKSTNYMPAIFAMKKAQQRCFDDAVYLNDRQEILEGTTSNAFFLKDEVWFTDDSDQIVKGVTRKILIDLIVDRYPIRFQPIRLEEVASCQEAFLCSSVKDVVPLVQIDEIKVGCGVPGSHTSNIRRIFREYRQNYFIKESNHDRY